MKFSATDGSIGDSKETTDSLAPPADPDVNWLEIGKTPSDLVHSADTSL